MIEVRALVLAAGTFRLGPVSFAVDNGRYAVLMGRTGCGKTTLIETLCGLRRAAAGVITIAGRDITDLPPRERRIAYVPQDGALFATMSVRDHLAFAPRLRRRPAATIDAAVDRLAGELGIAGLLDRRPAGLSGGERQRVALGRALAAEPAVLLLDEPLSALDEPLQDELADLLRRIQRGQGVTVLHITHSRREAERLADVRLRLADGTIVEEPAGG